MPNPVSDDEARTRFFVIGASRLLGVVIALTGIVALAGRIGIPPIAAYAFIAFGLFDFFAVPQVLPRTARTPRE
mgnify:CR=1 FL=1